MRSDARHTRITIATGGQEAIALLKQQSFSLILLDMMMPGMTGDEVLKVIKENPDTRDTPVVVLSAELAVRVIGGVTP